MHLSRLRRIERFSLYKQFIEYGLRGKIHVIGGMTAFDEAVLRNMGDEAVGILTACWYSAELDNPLNKKFAAVLPQRVQVRSRLLRRSTYVEGEVLEARCNIDQGEGRGQGRLHGGAARNEGSTPCVGRSRSTSMATWSATSISARSSERKGASSIPSSRTYPNVSQFWTYDKAILKNPVYSRDWPPAKNLEL